MCFPYHLEVDHIAYRTTSRYALAEMLRQTQNYKIATEFQIEFDDGSKCDCLVMKPPISKMPEIFISDGLPGSIVGDWVKDNGGGGIHHIALRIPSDLTVEFVKKEWERLGWAEFLTDEPIKCEGLTQIFTKPSHLTGHIYELIERSGEGFCKDSVKALMETTR